MNLVFMIAAVALAAMLFFPMYRIVRGPTIFDRLIGAGMMGTKTTVLLVLMGHLQGRADMYVDISLGYGLALLVGTLVTAKYLQAVGRAHEGTEQGPDEPTPAEGPEAAP